MRGLSIAIDGEGVFFQVWPTHAMTRFPQATIYDRSPLVTAFRQAEVKLGQDGHLDAAGQAAAKRIAKNLANPPVTDVSLHFSGPIQNGTVKVKCKNGTEKVFQVRLNGLSDKQVRQAFVQVDAAITSCKIARSKA